MPGKIREPKVHFKAYASRQPEDDERFVMDQYKLHADTCRTCSRPYSVFERNGSLCTFGEACAKDVRKYIYEPFAQDPSKTQLEFPSDWDSCDRDIMRDLLKAIAAGMSFSSRKPVVSQSRHSPEPRKTEQYYYDDGFYEIVERSPRPTGRSSRVEQEPPIVGRGSLYKKDEADRRRRKQTEEPIIVLAAPKSTRQRVYNR
ncbi:hypothetical protein UCRPC4_g06154 [Phaeomoniella chlamydospora]|uniref:Uncharacterized protein n=1 Tax=Phaeomoniella chlamydospora TaxID=158046 RepID=A0A0G2FV42_PHACM|nr:hypothetical protein UCRPC4_g06154 [Phaeomoniella chlamydospora]